VATDRGANGLPPAGVAHELAAGASAPAAVFETTEVQPRLLPTEEVVVDDDRGFNGRGVCADGARRSASLPRTGATGDAIVDESRGVGIRMSMRRMSCTLKKHDQMSKSNIVIKVHTCDVVLDQPSVRPFCRPLRAE
jgi:hypothetical protein